MFPLIDVTPYAFIGPMICALSRPLGGWMGDHIGGGIATMLSNGVMALATVGVYLSMPTASSGGSFWLFLAMFQLIFFAAGVGNGSSFQLAPKVFLLQAGQQAKAAGLNVAEAYARGGRRGASAMNVSSVMAAFGGFVIPKSFGSALAAFGSFLPAFGMFFVFIWCPCWWLGGNTAGRATGCVAEARDARAAGVGLGLAGVLAAARAALVLLAAVRIAPPSARRC